MTRVITLPSGKRCTLATYIQGWKALKAMTPEQRDWRHFENWSWHSNTGTDILREIRRGVHDRINQRGQGLRTI